MTSHDPPATLSDQNPSACVHCGAVVVPRARSCWLCDGKITPSAAQDALPLVRTSPLMRPLTHSQALMFWLGAIVATLVGYGVARSHGLIFITLYSLTVVPALVVTLICATAGRAAGKPWTPGQAARVGGAIAAVSFSTVAAIVATIVAMVAMFVSAIVAFFESCASMLGGR